MTKSCADTATVPGMYYDYDSDYGELDDEGTALDDLSADEEVVSLTRDKDKVCFDFRLGELPLGVQHEGQAVQLGTTQASGQATVLKVESGSYLRLPLDFPEEDVGEYRDEYTLVVELRSASGRPFSLFQATWPEVSVSHATMSECLVGDGRVTVALAESESQSKALLSQERFCRLYFVREEGSVRAYVNGDLVLSTTLPSSGAAQGPRPLVRGPPGPPAPRQREPRADARRPGAQACRVPPTCPQ